jgi:hypothetical protein
MSDASGRSISTASFYELGFAAQMLVWAMRKRLHRLAGAAEDSHVAHVFELADLDGLYEGLASIAEVLACAAAHEVQLHAVSCPCLAPHEVALLDALADLQCEERERAFDTMSAFIGHPAARLVWPSMQAIVDDLDARALRLERGELTATVHPPWSGGRNVVH